MKVSQQRKWSILQVTNLNDRLDFLEPYLRNAAEHLNFARTDKYVILPVTVNWNSSDFYATFLNMFHFSVKQLGFDSIMYIFKK